MPAEVERKLVTILFTDLVGSTEVMQRLGDDRAQAVFQAHHDFLRDTAVALGGDLLEWTGDGVMAIFPAISDAIRCAIAAQITSPRDADEEVPGVRVGLNVGEVLRHELGSGYFGTPIVIARRLCDQARAGQVICSTAAAGLVAGSRSFEFRELGPLRLKGISEPVAASEVVYRAKPSPRLLPTALEQLVQNLPDVVVATNELGLVTFFNRGAEEALGYSSDEILGRPVVELYPTASEARRVWAAMRDLERGGPGRVANFPTVFARRTGEDVSAVISGSVLYDTEGNEIGSIGVSRIKTDSPPDE